MLSCQHPSDQVRQLFPARDYITGDRFEVIHCARCGNTLTNPLPTDLSRYYPTGYYGASDARRFPFLVEMLQQSLYRRRVKFLEKHCRTTPGHVLDVGCGRGLLLDAFRKRGWTVQGTELSETAAKHARDVLGLPVSIGELSTLGLPAEQFDVVTLWHVLEHVSDPLFTLQEVNRLLRPGGLVFVGVPNFGGWESRLCRDKWFHLDVPRHLVHFPAGRLNALLNQAGFAPVASSGFAPEYDHFSFVQSMLNRTGLRHNLLYNVLRQGAAKVLRQQGTPKAQLAATFLLGSVLGVISIPWVMIAGWTRQAGTMVMVARKSAAR